MDRIHRAQHAMRKIAKQLDPEVDVGLPDLPDRPPGMRCILDSARSQRPPLIQIATKNEIFYLSF